MATANALRVVAPPTKYTATDNFLYLRGGADSRDLGQRHLPVGRGSPCSRGSSSRQPAPRARAVRAARAAAAARRKGGIDRRARPQRALPAEEAHAAKRGAAGTVTAIKSKKEFDALLAATPSKRLVVVDFFATWCGPCQQIAPKYEAMAAQFQQAKFVKVDVDICKELSQSYGVSSMPTFKMIRGGKVVDEMNGADENALKEKIQGLAGKADRWASGGRRGRSREREALAGHWRYVNDYM